MKKYFVELNDKVGTCYFEFAKGQWDKKTFWSEDSIYIHGEDLVHCDFWDIVIDVIPNCNPFGETAITKNQWNDIKKKVLAEGGKSADIVRETEEWIAETFRKHSMFTILGI